jgi:hypothetical protein
MFSDRGISELRKHISESESRRNRALNNRVEKCLLSFDPDKVVHDGQRLSRSLMMRIPLTAEEKEHNSWHYFVASEKASEIDAYHCWRHELQVHLPFVAAELERSQRKFQKTPPTRHQALKETLEGSAKMPGRKPPELLSNAQRLKRASRRRIIMAASSAPFALVATRVPRCWGSFLSRWALLSSSGVE